MPIHLLDQADAALRDVTSRVPVGKTGSLGGYVTTSGIVAEVGMKKGNLNLGGWASKPWAGGWTAGVGAGWSW